MMFRSLILATALFPLSLIAQETPPRSLDDRLGISLFAEDPLLNTPTGIDVDHKGRVWVIESNTHFPPEGYKGHSTDRLLILEDSDGDGKAEAKVFIDGFTHTMSVAVKPVWLDPILYDNEKLPRDIGPPTQVFVATRNEILLLEDTDGDDKCDKQTRLVHLETEGNYPHNGLAGFAFDGLGNMFFGFGENLGADYKIIGRDGTTYSGGGAGGNIYQVQPDGTKLKHWATGFWNPHANCVDAFGNLFSVDNDPDSLPPCRLLHIIEGGDYGYRYRNGRTGFHPFTCWNGEIPGTLPMVAGTGEAPSGILAYEHDAFPEEYLGNLIVTSWGDHRIDRFRLKRKGASFESVAEPFIVGGENFRPVGIALAPDGSLYLSDWVLRDYKLHGKGRVWRIEARENAKSVNSEEPSLETRLTSDYLSERRLAAKLLAHQPDGEGINLLLEVVGKAESSARSQVEALWAFSLLPKTALPANAFFPIKTEEEQDTGGHKIDPHNFEVFLATMKLIGTPHFPTPTDFVGANFHMDLFKTDNQLGWFQAEDARNKKENESLQAYLAVYYPNFRQIRIHPRLLLVNEPKPTTQREASLQEAQQLINYSILLKIPLFDNDPFVRSTCLNTLLESSDQGTALDITKRYLFGEAEQRLRNENDEFQVPLDSAMEKRDRSFNTLLALYLRFTNPKDSDLAENALKVRWPYFKRLVVQWIAEENLVDLRPQVEALFNDPSLTPDLFMATLATLEMLDGKPPAEFDKTPPGKHVLPILRDNTKPANVRAIALRLVDPLDPELDPNLVRKLTESDDPLLRREAIRTAAMNPRGTDYCGLLKAVNDESLDIDLRAEALVGMARRMEDSTHARGVIKQFAKGDNPVLAREALRALREKTDERPVEPLAANAEPNQQAGRRLFFHPNGPGCYKCHTVEGRGGKIGPDLTTIGAASSREKLIESIRKPSQEVAPQFTTWAMISTEGKSYTGMIVHENKGDTVLGLKDGTTIDLKTEQVEERIPQKTSIMPDKLEEQMTEREFEDLLAFLESLK